MVLSRQRLAVSLVAFFPLLACSDTTDPESGPVVASVMATGPADTLGVADTVRVTAAARDAAGATLPRFTITWRSLHPLVARVDDEGLVTGIAPGNASIVATAGAGGDAADTVVVRVRRIPRALAIAGLADSMLAVYEPLRSGSPRDTGVATVRDASGTTLTVPVRWSSSDTAVATVSTTGVVTMREPGVAWIRADAGRTAVDSVRVRGFVPQVVGPPFTSFRLGGPSCGLATTGEAWCGSGSPLATLPVPGGFRFRTIAVAGGTACGLVAADSTLACWGLNGAAQLGLGTTTPASAATPVIAAGGRKFRDADIGAGNTVCAVGAADSLVYCWGGNPMGATGVAPSGIDSTVGAVPALPKALAVAVGLWHACAIVIDRSVWCWGDAGTYASVQGLGAARFRAPTQVAPAAGYVSIQSNDYGACMLDGAGAVHCLAGSRQGTDRTIVRALPGVAMRAASPSRGGESCAVSTAGVLTCWTLSVPDDDVTTLTAKPRLRGRVVLDVVASTYTLCTTTDDQVVLCW